MVDTRKIAIAAGSAALSGAAIFVALRPSGADPCPPGMVRLPSGECVESGPLGGAGPVPFPEEFLEPEFVLKSARACVRGGIPLESCLNCQEVNALRGFTNEFQAEAERIYTLFCSDANPNAARCNEIAKEISVLRAKRRQVEPQFRGVFTAQIDVLAAEAQQLGCP